MTGPDRAPSERQIPVSDDFSLALGRAVASRLVADPDGVRVIGRRNLVRAAEQHGPTAQHWSDRWRALLDGPDEDLVAVLTSPDEWARVLRQTSPSRECSRRANAGICSTRSERRAVRRDQLEHLIRAAGAILDDVDEAKSTLIDGTIGELSPFHSSFGVYAHDVGERTARLPPGWRDRLLVLRNENTAGLTGWCLDPHDLAVAKLVAGRPHDLEFCRALLRADLLDADLLSRRLDEVALGHEQRQATRRRLDGLARGVADGSR